MPRKNDAVVIARMTCPMPDCGQTAAVFQSCRGYLYTRCPACGADQRNGPEAQAYFWANAIPVAGVDPASIKRPRNLPASAGPIGTQPVPESVREPEQVPAKPEPARVAVDDRDPAPVTAPEPAPAPIGAKKSQPGRGGFVVFCLAMVGLTTAMIAATAGR